MRKFCAGGDFPAGRLTRIAVLLCAAVLVQPSAGAGENAGAAGNILFTHDGGTASVMTEAVSGPGGGERLRLEFFLPAAPEDISWRSLPGSVIVNQQVRGPDWYFWLWIHGCVTAALFFSCTLFLSGLFSKRPASLPEYLIIYAVCLVFPSLAMPCTFGRHDLYELNAAAKGIPAALPAVRMEPGLNGSGLPGTILTVTAAAPQGGRYCLRTAFSYPSRIPALEIASFSGWDPDRTCVILWDYDDISALAGAGETRRPEYGILMTAVSENPESPFPGRWQGNKRKYLFTTAAVSRLNHYAGLKGEAVLVPGEELYRTGRQPVPGLARDPKALSRGIRCYGLLAWPFFCLLAALTVPFAGTDRGGKVLIGFGMTAGGLGLCFGWREVQQSGGEAAAAAGRKYFAALAVCAVLYCSAMAAPAAAGIFSVFRF